MKAYPEPVEWLLTNNLGGYSSGGENGLPFRRFHALLVSSQNLERWNILSHLETSPSGRKKLLKVFPEICWMETGKNFEFEEKVAFSPSKNAVSVTLNLKKPSALLLKIRPYLALRRNWSLRKTSFSGKTGFSNGFAGIQEGGRNCFIYPGKFFRFSPVEKEISYPVDKIRDSDFKEILFSPGFFEVLLKKGETFKMFFSTEKILQGDFALIREKSRKKFTTKFSFKEKFFEKLLSASLDFDAGDYIIAGFPWFGAWGRDTMISIPGLLLHPGRVSKAEKIMKEASSHIKKGLLPNIFGGGKSPSCYNSVDASLWFVWALSEYKRIIGKTRFLREMKEPVCSIIENYIAGTDFGISMASDGLIKQGAEGYALTWMDAVYNGVAFTPRIGKPVEIQALWWNALSFAEEMGFMKTENLQKKVVSSFMEKFPLKEGFLADFIDPLEHPDKKIRPNQVIALALMKKFFTSSEIKKIVSFIKKHLATPFGLRTLSPEDKSYIGIYQGNLARRDSAYHQGTVWSWLLQFYGQISPMDKKEFVKIWSEHLLQGGLNSFSEIFDGDPPFYPRGCPHQAWSVAALLYISFLMGWIRKK